MNETLPVEISTNQDILKIIRPCGNRLILIRDEMPKFTSLGLEIPENSKAFKPYSGTIIALGASCKEAAVGMHVVFGVGSGTELTINKTKFLVLREPDLLYESETGRTFQDKVMVIPEATPKKIKSIIIPDTVEDQPQIGRVAYSGALCEEIKAGDRVLHGKFAGIALEFKKQQVYVMREADIFAVLDEE